MLRALASSISGAVRLPTLASPLLRAAPLATIAPQKWREIFRDWEPPAIPSTSLEAWVRDVHTGSDVGIVQLNRYIFGLPLRVDLLQRAVRWQLSRRFKGNHSAKDRAEVSGSTRKAMPQKHTGRARAGSIRAPQFRHGGVVFPPKPRSHAIDLPRKVRELSLRVALSVRYAGDDLVVATDDAQAHADHKTRSIVDIVRKNGWAQKSVLLVTAGDSVPNSLKLACQNLHNFNVLPAHALNVHSILQHDKLVMTRGAIEVIDERFRHRQRKASAFTPVTITPKMPFHPLYPQQVI